MKKNIILYRLRLLTEDNRFGKESNPGNERKFHLEKKL